MSCLFTGLVRANVSYIKYKSGNNVPAHVTHCMIFLSCDSCSIYEMFWGHCLEDLLVFPGMLFASIVDGINLMPAKLVTRVETCRCTPAQISHNLCTFLDTPRYKPFFPLQYSKTPRTPNLSQRLFLGVPVRGLKFKKRIEERF